MSFRKRRPTCRTFLNRSVAGDTPCTMEAVFGIGAYSPAEAGRLLQIPPATLRHWVSGYSYDHHGSETRQPPLWRSQYAEGADEPLLGFRDLLEARIVRGLRDAGLGMPTIRQCLDLARDLAGDEHPFSTRLFKTDGKSLFIEHGEGVLDLRRRQHVFRRVIEPTFRDLDFDLDAASRWWLNPSRSLVIDPVRSWGQPIVAETGVSISRLVQAVQAEESVTRVAEIFEIPVATVREAIAFADRTIH